MQPGLRARQTGRSGMGAGTTLQVLMLLCISSERTKGPTHHLNYTREQMLKPVLTKLAAEKFSHSSVLKFLFGPSSISVWRVQGNSYHIHPQEL